MGSIANSTPSSSEISTIVQISSAAKSAYQATGAGQNDGISSIQSRINQEFSDAKAAGTFITFDSSKGGTWLDLSSFTDDELAQIVNGKAGSYSQDLIEYTKGALNARLAKTLAPFEGSLAAYQTGVQQLYKAMSPDLRKAMGWDQSMLEASQRLSVSDEASNGKLNRKLFLEQLLQTIKSDGTLRVDTTLFGFDSNSIAA